MLEHTYSLVARLLSPSQPPRTNNLPFTGTLALPASFGGHFGQGCPWVGGFREHPLMHVRGFLSFFDPPSPPNPILSNCQLMSLFYDVWSSIHISIYNNRVKKVNQNNWVDNRKCNCFFQMDFTKSKVSLRNWVKIEWKFEKFQREKNWFRYISVVKLQQKRRNE